MAEYTFDLYPANDPAGKVSTSLQLARLARLTVGDQLSDAEFWPSLYGPGKGFIEIHGDDPDAAFIERRAWIAVYRTDVFPERPIGGFFLEEGDFGAVSTKEQVGRVLRFEGEGGKRYFDRAILGSEIYFPAGVARGSHNVPGKWTWNDISAGGVLTRLIDEGQNAPDLPYAAFLRDFTRDLDSNGDAWLESGDYQVDIGTRGDQVLADVQKRGVIVEVDEELNVFAYRDISDYRTDRTSGTFAAGKVRFEKGKNIGNDLPKRIAAKRERTHVLVRGKTGNYVLVDTDTDGNPLPGETFYDFLKDDTTSAVGTLTRKGQVHLTRLRLTSDQCKVQHLIGPGGASGEQGYDPGPDGDYWLGDLVTVHSGTAEFDYNEQAIEVASIRYFLKDGNWVAEVHLGSTYTDARTAAASQSNVINSIIQQVLVGDLLCEADQTVEQDIAYIGPISSGDAHLDASDFPDGAEEGDIVVVQATNVGLAAIPSGPGGWTSQGSGGTTNDGPGSDFGFRMVTKVLTAADLVNMTGWTFSNTDRIQGAVYRGVSSVAGLSSTDVGASGNDSTHFEVPPVTLSVGDGSSWVVAGGATNSNGLPASLSGLTERTKINQGSEGEAGFWDTGPVSSWAGTSAVITAAGWQCHALELVSGGGSETFLGDGRVELVGSSVKRKRCDDTEFWREESTDAPGINDDSDHGFRKHTIWINDDGEAWHADDVTPGAAVWTQIGGAGASHPDLAAHDALGLATDAELAAHTGDTSDAHDASAISILDTANDFTATDVEGALAELQSDAEAHLADSSDAHDASAISFSPTGTIAATDVQAAIAEVASEAGGSHPDLAAHDALGLATDSELSAHTGDTTDAHDASAISVVDSDGHYTGTEVEAVLEEIGDTIATLEAGGGASDHLKQRANSYVLDWAALKFGNPAYFDGAMTMQGKGTHTLAPNVIAFCPIYVPRTITVDRIGFNCTSAGVAGTAPRLGIYESDSNGLPGALLLDAGTVAATTTGGKEITISQQLDGDKVYWLAILTNNSITISAQGNVSSLPLKLVSMADTTYSNISVVDLFTYGALPNPCVPTLSNLNSPSLRVRIS